MDIVKRIIDSELERRTNAARDLKNKQDQAFANFKTAVLEIINNRDDLAWILDCGKYEFIREFEPVYTSKFVWVLDTPECMGHGLVPMMIQTARFTVDHVTTSISFDCSAWSSWNSGNMRAFDGNVTDMLVYACENFERFVKESAKMEARELLEASVRENNGGFHSLVFHPDYTANKKAALDLFEKLCKIDPANSETYSEWLDDWTRKYEAYLLNVEVANNLKAAQDSYRDAYLAWLRDCHTIYKHNLDVVKKVQTMINNRAPYPIFELTYSLVAFDQDEKFVEKERVYVKGYGTKDNVFQHLDGSLVKYYFPASCKVIQAMPSDGRGYVDYYTAPCPAYFDEDEMAVAFIIGTITKESIEQELMEAGFHAYPGAPNGDDVVDSSAVEREAHNEFMRYLAGEQS